MKKLWLVLLGGLLGAADVRGQEVYGELSTVDLGLMVVF